MNRSGSLDLPSYRLVCRTVRPGSFNQWTDVADRVCSVWDQMKPHRARAIKKEWGIKWRPGLFFPTKCPKKRFLTSYVFITSPLASSCIKNNQCKVLGSKWFSILAASADAEISSPPPPLFSWSKGTDQKWILESNKSIWGVSTRNGATHKMDSWLLISSYMVQSTKMGWFASASIESSRFLRPTTSTEPPSQGSDCPQSPHTWAALDSCHIGQVASQWRRHQSTSPS